MTASKYRIRIPIPLLIFSILNFQAKSSETNWWCGSDRTEAETKCIQSCPTGHGCPPGTVCFAGITSCSSSSSSAASVASSSSASSNDAGYYCGRTLEDANERCDVPCPTGGGCPMGEACWMHTSCGAKPSGGKGSGPASGNNDNINGGGSSWWSSSFASSSSTSTSSLSFLSSGGSADSLAGLTGTAAVEETFLQMKTAINEKLFLYETPMMQWVPSTVYRFDGFFDGLKIMHEQGVAGKKIYLGPSSSSSSSAGGSSDDCAHCHMYGLINVAAFLAQAMKETIRYDACDENSWDRVGADLMYPISNACGQLGQSYQDYHCSEEDKHMECEVDPQMTITAVTNAKWWGAPGPLKCGPKSLIPQTGHWDYYYNCDNIWGTPPETCDAYEGQKGGKAINDKPYPNAGGRTDVEGCCWWGRGAIQTSGVCNFGKLNYFLGKRAADDGRESRYPTIDFCKDPEAICSSKEHQELKWIAGLFYWISDVQQYDEGGWNYIDELHKFVENGLEGDAFINAVSGIVNRGCHNPPCGTGELDGGPERSQNFFDIIKEMKFSFVDVEPVAAPPPTNPPIPELIFEPSPTPPPTSRPTSRPTPSPTSRPTSPPYTLGPSPLIAESPPDLIGSSEVRYTCGGGYEFDASDTSIPPSAEVSFDYDIHNRIDVAVGDALRDIKASILSDIALMMGCQKTWSGRGRQLQQSSEGFENIIALQSSTNDLPDPDAKGCMIDIAMDDPATCTPISGGFIIHGKPGASESSMREIANSLKGIIKTGMVSGHYESDSVMKAIYIGDREKLSNDGEPTNAQSEGSASEPNEGLKIAIYALSCVCLILLCLLWFAVWTYREKVHHLEDKRRYDEEMAFNHFMMEKEETNKHNSSNFNYRGAPSMTPQVNNYLPASQRRPPPQPRDSSLTRNRREAWNAFENNERDSEEYLHFEVNESDSDRSTVSESLSESVEEMMPIETQLPPPPAPRNKPPRFDSNSHRKFPPPSRRASSESDSMSSSSSSSSSSGDSSSDDETFNDGEQEVPAAPVRPMAGASSRRPTHDNNSSDSTGYGMSTESFQSSSNSAREERQKRMAAARARAAKRHLT